MAFFGPPFVYVVSSPMAESFPIPFTEPSADNRIVIGVYWLSLKPLNHAFRRPAVAIHPIGTITLQTIMTAFGGFKSLQAVQKVSEKPFPSRLRGCASYSNPNKMLHQYLELPREWWDILRSRSSRHCRMEPRTSLAGKSKSG